VFVQREQASDLVDIEGDGVEGHSLGTRS
jgi:hypothetical protein